MKKLFPLFLIILLSINLTFCKKQVETQNFKPSDESLPQQQIENAFIVEMVKSDTVRTIKAKHLDNYPKKKIIIADTVTVTEYDKNKKVKSILSCNKANIDQIKDIYVCTGNVVVTTENGILKTPYLLWDKKSDKITAKNGVTLIRGENVLNGRTLVTNSKFEKVRINKVSAKGKLKEKDLRW